MFDRIEPAGLRVAVRWLALGLWMFLFIIIGGAINTVFESDVGTWLQSWWSCLAWLTLFPSMRPWSNS